MPNQGLVRLVFVASLQIEQDGYQLMQIAKWEKGSLQCKLEFPGVKRSLGELQQTALDRLVRGPLAPLASYIVIERVEQDTLELESSPTIGLPTRYVRHKGFASLKVSRTGLLAPLITAKQEQPGVSRISSSSLHGLVQR